MANIAPGVVDPYQATTTKTTHTSAGVTTQATGSNFYWLVCWGSSATFTSFVDNKGNTPILQGTEQTFASISTKARLYKVENGAGGAGHTSTLVITNLEFAMIILVEIVNAGATDIVTAWTDDVATPFTSPLSGTLGQAIEGLLAFCMTGTTSGTETLTWQNGFSSVAALGNSNFNTGGAGFLRVTANTSIQSSFTSAGGGTTEAVSILITIKESTAGGITNTKVLDDPMGLLSDSTVLSRKRIRFLSESLVLTEDVPFSERIITAEDYLTLNDFLIAVKTKSLALVMTEAVILSDGFVAFRRLGRAVSDALIATDGFTSIRRFVRSQDDNFSLIDTIVKSFLPGGGVLNTKVMSDFLVLTDSIIRTVFGSGTTYTKILTDAMLLVDDNSIRWVFRRGQLSELLTLADERVSGKTVGRNLAEALTPSDGFVEWFRRVSVMGEALLGTDSTSSNGVRTLHSILSDFSVLSDGVVGLYFPAVVYDVRVQLGFDESGAPVLGGY